MQQNPWKPKFLPMKTHVVVTAIVVLVAFFGTREIARRPVASDTTAMETEASGSPPPPPPESRRSKAFSIPSAKSVPGEPRTPGNTNVSLLRLPMLTDVERAKFESPEAMVLHNALNMWILKKLHSRHCFSNSGATATSEVAVRVQLRSAPGEAVVDGNSVEVVTVSGAPVPVQFNTCVTEALAGKHVVPASTSGLRSIRRQYRLAPDAPLGFPDGFEGSAGTRLTVTPPASSSENRDL